MTWSSEIQQGPNKRRQQTAGRRDIEMAGKLLAGPLDDKAAAIATTRVEHPDWTWRQIGDSLGMNKDVAVSVFRRRCQEAGLRAPYARRP